MLSNTGYLAKKFLHHVYVIEFKFTHFVQIYMCHLSRKAVSNNTQRVKMYIFCITLSYIYITICIYTLYLHILSEGLHKITQMDILNVSWSKISQMCLIFRVVTCVLLFKILTAHENTILCKRKGYFS